VFVLMFRKMLMVASKVGLNARSYDFQSPVYICCVSAALRTSPLRSNLHPIASSFNKFYDRMYAPGAEVPQVE